MELVCTGLNHRTAPVEIRDQAAIVPAKLPEALRVATERFGFDEVVIVSTCNRSEIWAVADDADSAVAQARRFFCEYRSLGEADLDRCLYNRIGPEAAAHVMRVVAGLDSMVVGETQVAAQVKEAFEAARASGSCGYFLERLFQQALHANKRVRSETRIGEGAVSVSHVAVELARKIFGDLSRRRVLVLGAGEMSTIALRALQDAGANSICVSNRTYRRALELSKIYGWDTVRWEDFPRELARTDIVIASTGASHTVVHEDVVREAMAKRGNEALFFIDIAVPRDVDPEVGDIYNVFLYNIDDLNAIADENRRRREAEVQKAERIIRAEVETFVRWVESLRVKSVIVDLRRNLDELRRRELEWLRSKAKGLDESDWQVIEQFSIRLMNKFLHNPTASLRNPPRSSDRAALGDLVRRLFGMEPKRRDKEPGEQGDE